MGPSDRSSSAPSQPLLGSPCGQGDHHRLHRRFSVMAARYVCPKPSIMLPRRVTIWVQGPRSPWVTASAPPSSWPPCPSGTPCQSMSCSLPGAAPRQRGAVLSPLPSGILYPLRLLASLHRLIGRPLTIPQHLIYRKLCNGMDTMEVVHYVASFRPLPVRWLSSRLTIPQSIAANGMTYVLLERDRLLPPSLQRRAGPFLGCPRGHIPRRLPPSHAPASRGSCRGYPPCSPSRLKALSILGADQFWPENGAIAQDGTQIPRCYNSFLRNDIRNTRCALDDQEFIQRVKEKIERLTDREIDLDIDREHPGPAHPRTGDECAPRRHRLRHAGTRRFWPAGHRIRRRLH